MKYKFKKNSGTYSMWPKVLPQISHQNIQNCLYFDCLFAHYVYMSGFYLYIS